MTSFKCIVLAIAVFLVVTAVIVESGGNVNYLCYKDAECKAPDGKVRDKGSSYQAVSLSPLGTSSHSSLHMLSY